VLHAIAKACGSLVSSLGGGEHAHLLVPLLEKLAENEETVIRTNVRTNLNQQKYASMHANICFEGNKSCFDSFLLIS
jgi:hypothetical protein